jgi:YjbR protein
MTAGDFRRLALSLPGASEGGHHGHADFRVAGKIFATLGYPDPGWGMVKLTPEQQHRFCQCDCFSPVKGGWGRRGATLVQLFGADAEDLKRALALAHRNITASIHRSPHHHSVGTPQTRRAARRAS